MKTVNRSVKNNWLLVAALALLPAVASAEEAASGAAAVPMNDVMEQLNTMGGDMSLGDLAKAQQAMARLEMLLQVENKLAEIEKARRERAEEADPIGAAARRSAVESIVPTTGYSVLRVAGTQGDYSAILIDPSRNLIGVRSGSTLPNGGQVLSISNAGVSVRDGMGTRVLPFGSRVMGGETSTQ